MTKPEPPIDIARNALIRIQSDAEYCYGKPFDWTGRLGAIAKEAIAAMENLQVEAQKFTSLEDSSKGTTMTFMPEYYDITPEDEKRRKIFEQGFCDFALVRIESNGSYERKDVQDRWEGFIYGWDKCSEEIKSHGPKVVFHKMDYLPQVCEKCGENKIAVIPEEVISTSTTSCEIRVDEEAKLHVMRTRDYPDYTVADIINAYEAMRKPVPVSVDLGIKHETPKSEPNLKGSHIHD